MTLLQFRVKQFRSVEDSGWISCDDVTTLVGVNEAGKSNLLLALWRLNPAKSEPINLLADMPRRLFAKGREEPGEYTFIEADFELSDAVSKAVAAKALLQNTDRLQVRVSMDFGGTRRVKFLNATPPAALTSAALHEELTKTVQTLRATTPPEAQAAVHSRALTALEAALETHPQEDDGIDLQFLNDIFNVSSSYSLPDTSPFKAALKSLWNEVRRTKQYFEAPHDVSGVKDAVLTALPIFVYYANYGNLDAEIYLPHAAENIKRTDLTGVASAKARTLRVLFEYVGLNVEEIRQMGEETQPGYSVTEESARTTAAKKTERQALLHSAQSNLTRDFAAWWKQGDYTFNFTVDGNYFRIFVSDRQRPEPIELENRSTGLQWFLSFFLVFLVERGSKGQHANAVLLLDEAGHSLHPLAQRDLAAFFANLSTTNQVIHTTQSPFLVDTNHVDRVKVVYIDSQGFTVASENLRAAEGQGNQQRSVYAVHAALGLSVSDTLLQGCLPVIVEGVSDQVYLSAIKNWLIQAKAIAPKAEVIFVPAGGTKGIKPLTSLLTAKEGALPPIVMDSDAAGRTMQATLKGELYRAFPKKLIHAGEFVDVSEAEIEDLIPVAILEPLLSRMFREVDDLFMDQYDPRRSLVDQIEAFAHANSVTLEGGWKVNLAKGFKNRLLAPRPPIVEKANSDMWKKLFKRILDNA
jgi:predicted ATPase